MITTGENIPTIQELGMNADVYYNKSNSGSRDILQKLHNYIKSQLIVSNSVSGQTMIDFACGKGGDLWKWDEARLSFVFGVDYSRDNIENRFDCYISGSITPTLNQTFQYCESPKTLFSCD